jgi:hypothetical protein
MIEKYAIITNDGKLVDFIFCTLQDLNSFPLKENQKFVLASEINLDEIVWSKE